MNPLSVIPANFVRRWASFCCLSFFCAPSLLGQTYVTPKLGGGQEPAAEMIHINLWYDAEANVFNAILDPMPPPFLRAVNPGQMFDPQTKYAVLNGKAYNAQYGWNAYTFFSIPAGAAIWIEQLDQSPELEVYQDYGRTGSYTPIFGTAGSSRRWQWSGVMVHNSYAVLAPASDRYFAEYHIYFGDATTGSRANYTQYDDAYVRLEWDAVPTELPGTLHFGAAAPTVGAPLVFLNSTNLATNSGRVAFLGGQSNAPASTPFVGTLPMSVLPATAENVGPAPGHAAAGSCLALQLVSLSGPPGGRLAFRETNEGAPLFSIPVGETQGTNCVKLSASSGEPGCDPYGTMGGREFLTETPGLYVLGFRLVDLSANGPAGGPLHSPSPVYSIYVQAGLTLAACNREGQTITATFAGPAGREYYLERATSLSSATHWQTIAGPIAGTNALQRLTGTNIVSPAQFYRVRAMDR